MNTQDDIPGLNNRGVELLCSERFKEAIIVFKRAYEIVIEEMRRAPSSTPTKSIVDQNIMRSHWACIARSKTARSVGAANNNGRTGLVSKNLSFVFRRALFMQTSSQSPVSKQIEIIVSYNLALSLHLYGLMGRPGYTAFLRRSSVAYKKVGRALVNCQGIDMVIHVALLNNMGQVYHELGQYKAAGACFDHLCHSLPFVNNDHTFNSQEHEGMLLNLIVLKKPCMAAAA